MIVFLNFTRSELGVLFCTLMTNSLDIIGKKFAWVRVTAHLDPDQVTPPVIPVQCLSSPYPYSKFPQIYLHSIHSSQFWTFFSSAWSTIFFFYSQTWRTRDLIQDIYSSLVRQGKPYHLT